MARWKLVEPHYLNVPGEEWEYTENDRTTGRPKRVKFSVPRLLDPKDPTCWSHRYGSIPNTPQNVIAYEDGVIIVCHVGKGESGDIEFIGDPTPAMIPLDDEAKEISASFADHWRYKPEESPITYSQSLVDKFQVEIANSQTKPAQIEGLAELVSAITQMAAGNQKLVEALSTTRRL
jgi:hypothetical protein